MRADIHEHLQQRRSSYNIEYGRNRTGGSASKVDLLKSALEINHKASHTSVSSRTDRTSNQSLNRYRADSAPKLNLGIPKSIIIPSAPVLEGVESNFVRYDRHKYRSRAQLQMIPADEPMTTSLSFDADDERRDSIPEEPETQSQNHVVKALSTISDESDNNLNSETNQLYPNLSNTLAKAIDTKHLSGDT